MAHPTLADLASRGTKMAGKRKNWVKKAVSPDNKDKMRENADKSGRLHARSEGKEPDAGPAKRRSPFYAKD